MISNFDSIALTTTRGTVFNEELFEFCLTEFQLFFFLTDITPFISGQHVFPNWRDVIGHLNFFCDFRTAADETPKDNASVSGSRTSAVAPSVVRGSRVARGPPLCAQGAGP